MQPQAREHCPVNRFPEDFMWGTASSSTQVEGSAPASDWWLWERDGKVPPSEEGSGFAWRFAEDFRDLSALGLRHHRLSLEWARLEPEEGRHDPAEVERYRELLGAARSAGLDPWVCLHHFTLPRWFTEEVGGFLSERGLRYHWPRHVEWMAETFGDLVAGWKPVNEPLAYAAAGWLFGLHPPGRSDLSGFGAALRAAHLANVEAWKCLHPGGAPVATVMNLSPVTACASPSADDDAGRQVESDESAVGAADSNAELLDRVYWRCWMSLLQDGIYDDPFGEPVEVPEAAGAFDLVGFSYYTPVSVDEDLGIHPYPPDAPLDALGNALSAEGLRQCLDRLAREMPGRRLLISEVGVGTSAGDPDGDALRCAYMEQVARVAADALVSGVDLAGLFWWTNVDNYEWSRGFEVDFGLIARDRVRRPSAALAATLAGAPA